MTKPYESLDAKLDELQGQLDQIKIDIACLQSDLILDDLQDIGIKQGSKSQNKFIANIMAGRS